MKRYIHYGHNSFDKEKFIEIRNDGWIKPIGGLWASSIKSKFGWKDWCNENKFRECNLDNSFTFELKKESKVLVIDNAKKLLELPKLKMPYKTSWINLDFERIKKDYDAIEVLISSDHKLYLDLYGWDCDSLLVLNPEVIVDGSNKLL